MMSIPPIEESFADDIVQVSAYSAILPKVKNFLPWHLPRKQYVRQYQWCTQIKRMINDSPLIDGTLKYLGLPGLDLIDLRHFHAELCTVHNIELRFLGFNSSARPASDAQTELNISLDEVRRLPRVDPRSDVIGDNFALVAKENSIAARKARELGPYDVINLDLCDGFGAQAPGAQDHSYYDAITSLFALQSRSKSPWLLLLTTRVDKKNIDEELLEALLRKYISNLNDCEQFKNASKESFTIHTEEELRTAIDTPDGMLSVFLTGLCKWFLGLSLAQQPPTILELKSVIGYRVEHGEGHEDLFSLALRFTPSFAPVEDPLGIARQPGNVPDEGTLATKALKRIAKRINADQKLLDDDAINAEMIKATCSLLQIARYDTSEYVQWVDETLARMTA
jgi:hypothetical protein